MRTFCKYHYLGRMNNKLCYFSQANLYIKASHGISKAEPSLQKKSQ